MCSNKVLDKRVTVEPTQEPVTDSEVKEYMKVDYADSDIVISQLIVAARQLLEEKYDIGIAGKTLEVIVDNTCGGIELPGAPIGNVTGMDRDGNAVTLTTTGSYYKFVESPCLCYLKLTYTSGWDNPSEVPLVFRTAIKQQVLWMFEHLGDEVMQAEICPMAQMSLQPFRRNGTGLYI